MVSSYDTEQLLKKIKKLVQYLDPDSSVEEIQNVEKLAAKIHNAASQQALDVLHGRLVDVDANKGVTRGSPYHKPIINY